MASFGRLPHPTQTGPSLPLRGASVRDHVDAVQLFAPLVDCLIETLGLAYLDPNWTLLDLHIFPGEGRDYLCVPNRAIAARALSLGASAVIMAHNHPSGNSAPSAADICTTRLLARALALLDVRLVDHLVLSRAGSTSFRALGLL
ncbi:MAG: JAB domain-containing protein [Sphingomonas sp.]|jgi:DNA repair protein RadC